MTQRLHLVFREKCMAHLYELRDETVQIAHVQELG